MVGYSHAPKASKPTRRTKTAEAAASPTMSERKEPVPAVSEKLTNSESGGSSVSVDLTEQKVKLMAAIKQEKKFFYGTVVAQAQRIELEPEVVTFTFTPGQKTLATQLAQNTPWLEEIAETVLGRKLAVRSAQGMVSPSESLSGTSSNPPVETVSPETKTDKPEGETLRPQVMDDTFVKAMVDVLSAEIDDVQKL